VYAHPLLQTSLPHILVLPDLVAARKVGLTPGDIRRQSSAMIAREEVSDVFRLYAAKRGRRPRSGVGV
jgi:hypothetical protein